MPRFTRMSKLNEYHMEIHFPQQFDSIVIDIFGSRESLDYHFDEDVKFTFGTASFCRNLDITEINSEFVLLNKLNLLRSHGVPFIAKVLRVNGNDGVYDYRSHFSLPEDSDGDVRTIDGMVGDIGLRSALKRYISPCLINLIKLIEIKYKV